MTDFETIIATYEDLKEARETTNTAIERCLARIAPIRIKSDYIALKDLSEQCYHDAMRKIAMLERDTISKNFSAQWCDYLGKEHARELNLIWANTSEQLRGAI